MEQFVPMFIALGCWVVSANPQHNMSFRSFAHSLGFGFLGYWLVSQLLGVF